MPLPPDKDPTHTPLDLEVIWDVSDALEEKVSDGRLTPDVLATVAREAEVPVSHVYVAASVDPELEWVRQHDLCFHVCAGGCQSWGAVETLEALLAERDARVESGRPAFDVTTAGCLNACDRPPAVVSVGDHGQGTHPETAPGDVRALVEALTS